jgi:biotin carboxylase
MARVLLLSTTTGYQVRAFGEAAEQLGVDLVYATDRCHMLDDPWRDEAVPIRFHDEEGSAAAILQAAKERPIDGVLAVGDRPAAIAAYVLRGLGLPGHPPEAAAAARNKLRARERFRDANLPTPAFLECPLSAEPAEFVSQIAFPCVVKPLALSGSRGVMRADNEAGLVAAWFRLRALLQAPDVASERSALFDRAIVEDFIEGREYALEGLLEHGALRVLAIYDKPDPLDGPFFEETIYVTPSAEPESVQEGIATAVTRAARALGLRHGPVHAECRVNSRGVFVLEVAARPIGGLCARTLRFDSDSRTSNVPNHQISFEELLLRHALGEPARNWQREKAAAAVMMIPIPRRGVFRSAQGIDRARAVASIEDVRLTAKADQVLVPLPEGASYLGFIFARAAHPDAAVRALRTAHKKLDFTIDPEVRVLQSHHG